MAEWGKVYGSLHSDPKWLGATKGAKALWITALSWCVDHHKTDGRVPKELLWRLGGHPMEAACLVRQGLWDEVDHDGWVFHDWTDYQRTSAQVEAGSRAGKTAATARWSDADRNADRNADRMRIAMQSRVEKSREETTRSADAEAPTRRRKPERPLPDDLEPNDGHREQARTAHVNLAYELARFRNYAQANDRRVRDWDAAFRNWLLKAAKDGRPTDRNGKPLPDVGNQVWLLG